MLSGLFLKASCQVKVPSLSVSCPLLISSSPRRLLEALVRKGMHAVAKRRVSGNSSGRVRVVSTLFPDARPPPAGSGGDRARTLSPTSRTRSASHRAPSLVFGLWPLLILPLDLLVLQPNRSRVQPNQSTEGPAERSVSTSRTGVPTTTDFIAVQFGNPEI